VIDGEKCAMTYINNIYIVMVIIMLLLCLLMEAWSNFRYVGVIQVAAVAAELLLLLFGNAKMSSI